MNQPQTLKLTADDSQFLAILRALAILVIMLGHAGLFWLHRPHSEFLHVFVAVFFFISGAVAYPSWVRNPSWADYLKKRLPGLFIPWYLICLLALLVYGLQHGQLPQWSAEHLYRWLTMAPRQASMPIPLGQVWFLNTLLWLSLAAPGCFWLYHHQRRWFVALLLLPLLLASWQLFSPIHRHFAIALQELFKPSVHLLFFALGALVMNEPRWRHPGVALAVVGGGISLSLLLVNGLALDADYAHHTYAPDLYYVAGCLAAIWALLLAKPLLLWGYRQLASLRWCCDFLFKHTFALFLLHAWAIALSQALTAQLAALGLLPGGLSKGLVIPMMLLLSGLMALPFSALCERINGWFSGRLLRQVH